MIALSPHHTSGECGLSLSIVDPLKFDRVKEKPHRSERRVTAVHATLSAAYSAIPCVTSVIISDRLTVRPSVCLHGCVSVVLMMSARLHGKPEMAMFGAYRTLVTSDTRQQKQPRPRYTGINYHL